MPTQDKRLPRVAALHDLSCFGRCALTVVLPTLAAMGIQPIPLPTALLSTHTGGFTDMYFDDLTAEMEQISAHWQQLGLDFDAIYTGFLGSEAQIETVERFIAAFSGERHPLVLIDPVMGDDGELYSTYTPAMVERIKSLCAHADLITPNLTEACLLTGCAYRDPANLTVDEGERWAEELLDALSALGARAVLLTGLPHGDGISVAGEVDGKRFLDTQARVHANYPGTGDLFASVLLGKLLQEEEGLSPDALRRAAAAAASFVSRTISLTLDAGTPVRDGVLFEAVLHELCEK